MIVSGAGWITEQACGSLRRGWQTDFKDPKVLYQQLEEEGIFETPLKKVRWLNAASRRTCFAAALALRDAFENPAEIRFAAAQTGMVGMSRDGALKGNLEFFRDYVQSGRKLARGNLFVHTLPTSSLAEAAITFGLKGPVFHLAAGNPKLNLLVERGEALGRRSRELSLLCCAETEEAVLCIFLTPERPGLSEGHLPVKELRRAAGNLWEFSGVVKALKSALESVQTKEVL